MTLSFALDDLCVDRGRAAVVQGVTFSNGAPAWIGLIGANGSGKTTLLRAIAGRLPVASGRILLGGADVTTNLAARANQIGFAVEGEFLPGDLTPRELYAISANEPRPWQRAELQQLGRALRIDHLLDSKCGILSAGMAQRVAIFGAFLDLARIVILDEPFNWLDPVTAFDVKLALTALVQDHGVTIVTSLHDVTTLTSYCTRGVLLSAGRIALTLEVDDLAAGKQKPAAFEAMVVDQLREASD